MSSGGFAIHQINQGDQLFKIMADHYGPGVAYTNRAEILTQIQKANPHIRDIDLIFAGETIALPPVPGLSQGICQIGQGQSEYALSAHARELADIAKIAKRVKDAEEGTNSLVSRIDFTKIATETGKSIVDQVGKSALQAANEAKSVALNYYRYKAGTITKGQYDLRRRVSIDVIDHDIGFSNRLLKPAKQLLKPGQATTEVIRIRPHAEIRTERVLKHVSDLQRVAKTATRGITLLKWVNAGFLAAEFEASTAQQRTGMLFREAGGMSGSFVGAKVGAAVATAALGLFMVATPAGWVVAAVAIAGGVAGGIGGGLLGEKIGRQVEEGLFYDANGNRMDNWFDRLFDGRLTLPQF